MTFDQLLASLGIRDEAHLRELVNTHGITTYQRHQVAAWFGVRAWQIAPNRWQSARVSGDDRREAVPA